MPDVQAKVDRLRIRCSRGQRFKLGVSAEQAIRQTMLRLEMLLGGPVLATTLWQRQNQLGVLGWNSKLHTGKSVERGPVRDHQHRPFQRYQLLAFQFPKRTRDRFA